VRVAGSSPVARSGKYLVNVAFVSVAEPNVCSGASFPAIFRPCRSPASSSINPFGSLCRLICQFETLPKALVQARKEVPVTVERDSNCGMSKAFLDFLWMCSLRDEQGSTCMS
jgi:hypothetical protein